MARRRQSARNKPPRRAPITSATYAARQQLIGADVLALAATQQRMGGATKGTFGGRTLRAGGSTLSGYMIGGFGAPSSPKKPKRGSAKLPQAQVRRVSANIRARKPRLGAAAIKRQARRIVRRRLS